jgi:hypothetical protein
MVAGVVGEAGFTGGVTIAPLAVTVGSLGRGRVMPCESRWAGGVMVEPSGGVAVVPGSHAWAGEKWRA